MMPNELERYGAGPNAFEFKGTNGFILTFDMTAKDVSTDTEKHPISYSNCAEPLRRILFCGNDGSGFLCHLRRISATQYFALGAGTRQSLSSLRGFHRKQMASRRVANGKHARMLHFPFDRDSIEATANILGLSNFVNGIMLKLFLEDRRNRENAGAGLSKGSQQGIVLKLSRDERTHSLGVEPGIEVSAELRVLGRQQDG